MIYLCRIGAHYKNIVIFVDSLRSRAHKNISTYRGQYVRKKYFPLRIRTRAIRTGCSRTLIHAAHEKSCNFIPWFSRGHRMRDVETWHQGGHKGQRMEKSLIPSQREWSSSPTYTMEFSVVVLKSLCRAYARARCWFSPCNFYYRP